MSDACTTCGCRGCILFQDDESIEVCCSGCGKSRLEVATKYVIEANDE